MKKNPLTLLLFPALAAHAQPSLTYPDAAPTPGQSFLVKYGEPQAAGPAGANQTWNFASLAADSSNISHIMPPDQAPGGSNFPQATAAVVNSGQATFVKAEPIGLFYLAASILGQQVTFNEPAQYLAYPCTYNTGWEGTYAGSLSLFGFDVDLTGEVIGVADGYGTLILPEGTVTNVLRVKRDDITSIVTLLGTFTITSTSYLFFKPGIDLPILEITSIQGDIPGAPIDTQRLQWIDVNSIGIAEQPDSGIALVVFPNPATTTVAVHAAAAMGAMVRAEVFDLSGRRLEVPFTLGHGDGSLILDVSGLRAGTYVIRTADASGATGSARVVVH